MISWPWPLVAHKTTENKKKTVSKIKENAVLTNLHLYSIHKATFKASHWGISWEGVLLASPSPSSSPQTSKSCITDRQNVVRISGLQYRSSLIPRPPIRNNTQPVSTSMYYCECKRKEKNKKTKTTKNGRGLGTRLVQRWLVLTTQPGFSQVAEYCRKQLNF